MQPCLSPNGMNRFDLDAAPTRLLVATADGLVALERAAPGAAWRVGATVLAGQHVSTLTGLPHGPGVLAGTHGDGIYYSADGTTGWERRNDGVTHPDIYTLAAVERAGRTTLYAGTQPAALFRSEDLGRSWQELPALLRVPGTESWTFPAPPRIAHTKMLAIDLRNPDTIYAAIEQGALLKTSDGGKSWRELDDYSRADDRAYKDIHQVLLRPSNPAHMLMTTGVGLYTSSDAGEHWERLTGPEFRLAYPDHLMLSPDERVLFLSGGATDPGVWRKSHDAGTTIVRSRDFGRTWDLAQRGAKITPHSNIEAMTLVAYPGGYSLFLGNTEGEVYASEDGGETWAEIAGTLAPVSKGDHHLLLPRVPAAAAHP
jgi:photosystem II stability/assembly factor-like uncharacterized protein